MVGQVQTAGADADAPGSGCDGSGQDDVGGARHRRHVVMIGEPVAVEAEAFGVGGEFDRAVQGVADGVAAPDRGEVEEGAVLPGVCECPLRQARPRRAVRVRPSVDGDDRLDDALLAAAHQFQAGSDLVPAVQYVGDHDRTQVKGPPFLTGGAGPLPVSRRDPARSGRSGRTAAGTGTIRQTRNRPVRASVSRPRARSARFRPRTWRRAGPARTAPW